MEHDSAAQDADDAFDALDLGADSVVAVTVTGQIERIFFSFQDTNIDPAVPPKLWEATGNPQLPMPVLRRSIDRIIGRVLDVREELPDGRIRRTLWRLP